MNTIQHVRAEIRRFSDLDIKSLRDLIEGEYNRRFEAEKQSKEAAGAGLS